MWVHVGENNSTQQTPPQPWKENTSFGTHLTSYADIREDTNFPLNRFYFHTYPQWNTWWARLREQVTRNAAVARWEVEALETGPSFIIYPQQNSLNGKVGGSPTSECPLAQWFKHSSERWETPVHVLSLPSADRGNETWVSHIPGECSNRWAKTSEEDTTSCCSTIVNGVNMGKQHS